MPSDIHPGTPTENDESIHSRIASEIHSEIQTEIQGFFAKKKF